MSGRGNNPDHSIYTTTDDNGDGGVDDEFIRSGGRKIITVSAADLQLRAVDWLWHGWLPVGGLALLVGNENHGKGLTACGIIARASRGELDSDDPVTSIIATTEDSWEATIGPRLVAADADLSRVQFVKVQAHDHGKTVDSGLELPKDAEILSAAAAEHEARIVWLDPITGFLGRTDSHKGGPMREALSPITAGAERHGFVLLGTAHTNRERTNDPRLRSGESIALRQIARVQMFLGLHPDDPTGEDGGSRVLAHGKGNLSKRPRSIELEIQDARIEGADGPIDTARMEWGGTIGYSAKDVLAAQTTHEQSEELAKATRFLLDQVPGKAAEIKAAAKERGIAARTLERAAEQLRIPRQRDGERGPYLWLEPGEIGGGLEI